LGQSRSKVLPFSKKGLAQSAASASKIDVSASSASRDPAMPEEDLRAAVLKIVLYGTLLESKHSAQDRSYRNISERDILAMLEGKWSLAAAPEWDERHRSWKYKLKGVDLDGDELELVIAVDVEMNLIHIITKF